MVISVENFKRQTMNEELTLNDIVGFVEAFGPFWIDILIL